MSAEPNSSLGDITDLLSDASYFIKNLNKLFADWVWGHRLLRVSQFRDVGIF
jgi:hypothetical protein